MTAVSRSWPVPSPSDVHRFWSKVEIDDPEKCWNWVAASQNKGYGYFGWAGKMGYAHQFAYIVSGGELNIPLDMVIDHICRNKLCVNPAHLRLVTPAQNAQNTSLPSHNTSGFRGVHWSSQKGKWCVQVKINGKAHHGGYFKTVEAAATVARGLYAQFFTHHPQDAGTVAATEYKPPIINQQLELPLEVE